MRVLVTGGAGYIGHHSVRELLSHGHEVLVMDDLSRGDPEHLRGIPHVIGNVGDRALVTRVLSAARFDAIMHFAGSIEVGESMRNPALYWENSVAATERLLDCAAAAGIRRFVFSSSAAVYGEPEQTPIAEHHPTRPINPYGETKLRVEKILAERGFEATCLRYFNACGLDEAHVPETHLIPRLLAAISDGQSHFAIYGDDYPTADGTCIRDFVHVQDLARAHRLALVKPGVFNLGGGKGTSVLEVLQVASRIFRTIAPRFEPRREGDPSILVADITRAQQELGWEPRFGLEEILESAPGFSDARTALACG